MVQPTPTPFGIALTHLRRARGWTQKQLATVAHMPEKAISDYERGWARLTRKGLEALTAPMGHPPEAIDVALLCVELLRPPKESVASPFDPSPADRQAIDHAVAIVVRAAAGLARSELTTAFREARIRQTRSQAETIYARLQNYSAQDRRVLVAGTPDCDNWALAELLCDKSLLAAPADARRATELATLALQVASQVPQSPFRSRLQGFCYFHLGNARRVANDLLGADQAFGQASELWKAGAAAGPDPLDEARVLDLEASLRRSQRRFPDALKLHDKALALTKPDDRAALLVNMALTLEVGGNHQNAFDVLQEASPLIDRRRQPRLLFALLFNLTVILCHAGRHDDAERTLPQIRELATRLDNRMDQLRVLWLEARVVAGLGRPGEAIAALERVCTDFAALDMSYDAALATMELAVLLAEQGRHGEVKELARHTATLFRKQRVHREALKALKLFREAAEREVLTVDLARRLKSYFDAARHNPLLRFDLAA